MKKCSKCKLLKELKYFHKCIRSPGGHKARCKDCRNTDNKKHREQNPEYYQKWRDSNKEQTKEYNKNYRVKNKRLLAIKKKRYISANKNTVIERQKQWYNKNKDKVMAAKRRRRARKIKVDENYSLYDREITLKEFSHRCFNCGTRNKLCIDHHRPLINGNALMLDNAVVLCKKCNSSKGIKSPEEFYGANVSKELDDKLISIAQRYINNKE